MFAKRSIKKHSPGTKFTYCICKYLKKGNLLKESLVFVHEIEECLMIELKKASVWNSVSKNVDEILADEQEQLTQQTITELITIKLENESI